MSDIIKLISDGNEGSNYLVEWRGQVIDGSWGIMFQGKPAVGFSSLESADPLLQESLDILSTSLRDLNIPNAVDWVHSTMQWPTGNRIDLNVSFVGGSYHRKPRITQSNEVALNFKIINWPDLWANAWSPYSFAEAVFSTANAMNDTRVCGFLELEESLVQDFGLTVVVEAKGQLQALLPECSSLVISVMETAINNLNNQSSSKTLTSIFNFPSSVATACEQYLLYFSQFLHDIGIEATTDILHKEKEVLFSVTPANQDTALAQINEALTIYLRLPSIDSFNDEASRVPGIAVRQLQANVFHLQSQLQLASAIVEAKDETISALRTLAYPKRQEKNGETILPGIEVTSYDGPGFRIDIPVLLRNLKRFFHRIQDNRRFLELP